MLGRNHGYVTTQGQIVADLLAADGFEITCVSSKINRALRLLEIVTTLIRTRREIDVVVLEVYSGMGFIIADVGARLGRLFNLPLIMFLHGGHLREFVEQYPRWTRSILNRADLLVAPSAFLVEEVGAFGYKISQIANVIDIDSYPFRERRGIEPRLLWMRSFHPIYNPEMAIMVLVELRKSVPNATLTLAGVDKGLEEKIKQMATAVGLSDAVRFPGFLDHAAKIQEFDAADIFLNTNRIDNMPVSVIEACAFGLPVVATAVGGVPYLIEHRVNGLLVANEDVTAMTSAIKELLSDPDLAFQISRRGRALAERSAWNRVRKDWEWAFATIGRPGRSTSKTGLTKDKLSAES